MCNLIKKNPGAPALHVCRANVASLGNPKSVPTVELRLLPSDPWIGNSEWLRPNFEGTVTPFGQLSCARPPQSNLSAGGKNAGGTAASSLRSDNR